MIRLVVICSATAAFPRACLSQSATAEELSVGAVGVGEALQVIVGLLLVLFLIAALAWVLRRQGGCRMSANPALSVLGTLPLGARERVVLVRVNGLRLLVGVAPGHVSMLHVFDEDEVEDTEVSIGTVAPIGFRQLLSRVANSRRV